MLFFFFLAAVRILDPGPGIEPRAPAVRVLSPNYWTAREFSQVLSFSYKFWSILSFSREENKAQPGFEGRSHSRGGRIRIRTDSRHLLSPIIPPRNPLYLETALKLRRSVLSTEVK